MVDVPSNMPQPGSPEYDKMQTHVKKEYQNDNVHPEDHPKTFKDHYVAQYHLNEKTTHFFRKMFPKATDEECQKMFDLLAKSVSDSIQQNQAFHEKQKEERDEDDPFKS